MQYEDQSEVARLKRQIADECESGKRALHAFTPVASHKCTTRGMERMWKDFEELQRIAGKEEADRFWRGL